MKKITVITLLYLTSFFTFAGEAIIPFWQTAATQTFTLNISNVSSTPASVKVTLYNKDGSIYDKTYTTDNGGALNQEFTIPPKQTVWIWIHGQGGTTIASSLRGYGRIESTEANDATGKAFIVAHGKLDSTNASRWMAVPINHGMPF